jgi:hypothetical protein
MDVNDDAVCRYYRIALKFIASKLAPTGDLQWSGYWNYLRATMTARIGAGSPSIVLL